MSAVRWPIGKYKDCAIEDIVISDPAYCWWALTNIKNRDYEISVMKTLLTQPHLRSASRPPAYGATERQYQGPSSGQYRVSRTPEYIRPPLADLLNWNNLNGRYFDMENAILGTQIDTPELQLVTQKDAWKKRVKIVYLIDLSEVVAESSDGREFSIRIDLEKMKNGFVLQLHKAKFLGIMTCIYVVQDAPVSGLRIDWLKE